MVNLPPLRRTWRRLISPVGRFLLLTSLGSGLVLMLALVPSNLSLPEPIASLTRAIAQSESSEIGWEFLGNRDLNQASITQTQYEGECPGTDDSYVEARFTSDRTPPGPRRRVIVRNITRGLASDPYPYTERDYDEGRSSEATRMEFGTRHSGRRFRVLEGENEFEYEIRERRQVIDSGRFTANIEQLVDVQRRDATAQTESVCMNSAVGLNVCADVRTRTNYTCPGGRVLRSVMQPNNPEISTLISNQTPWSMEYWVNGRIQQLPSGRERIYTGNSLSVEFQANPNCSGWAGCQPSQTLTLQPGRRYQFRSPQFGNGTIELADFPR
jgi:hypothetical protein